MFDDFWDDVDFPIIGNRMDLTPEKAKATREMLSVAQDWVGGALALLNGARAW